MNSNKFELIGNANYIDVKATDKGNIITRVLLGIYLGKDKEGKSLYDSVEITLFGETAEKFSEEIQKKDNVYLEGRIGVNKYTNKDGKEIKNIQFVANSYAKVSFDKDKKEFVAAGVNEGAGSLNLQTSRNSEKSEELPWNNK